ncbi:hypothetical protein ENH_00020640 [Eimeria necatrix]|uniref:Uncharacterized protein n=1 Tax=Eimeria necatrix TaxID=51315 RepID=U6MHN5_9EIME|nr:hypothetical protein ENH_00020640 [Eimeria necatrix]CDJ62558.1 hypothetical protein ENH_00020640 [Eimeria necatrix]
MHLRSVRSGRVVGPMQQDTSTMSVNKLPSEIPTQPRHATPKPTVAEQPHGRKETPQQVAPTANVKGMPQDGPYVTWDKFHSAMAVKKNVIGGPGESSVTSLILPADGSTMQAFLMRIERRYTQMGLETSEWGDALIDHPVGVVGDERSRPRSHGKGIMFAVATGPNAIPVFLERGNRLLNTVDGDKKSAEVVQGTQPPSEARLESGPTPMRNEEAPCKKTDSSGKSAEATEEDCRPEAIETMPH